MISEYGSILLHFAKTDVEEFWKQSPADLVKKGILIAKINNILKKWKKLTATLHN